MKFERAFSDDDILRLFEQGIIDRDLLDFRVFLRQDFFEFTFGGGFEPAMTGRFHFRLV